jgi:uncharacterized iron-regulated membrane protein
MKTPLKTFAVLVALASLPLAASADTTTPDKAAPPMTGTGDMMGMMGGGAMKMDGMQMDGMMGQMMQMMRMMEMMQLARMMNISGTPTFVIDHTMLRGYAAEEEMRKIVAEQRAD